MKKRSILQKSRFEICNYLDRSFDEKMSQDILGGLTADQKFIPCKYFYDSRGSRLFEMICDLPEYYLTRTELSILEEMGRVIMESFEEGDLVEMGSGANWKISKLIDGSDGAEGDNLRYIPVDVSKSALIAASDELIRKYPKLRVLGIVADFTCHMDLIPNDSSKLIILFGSTIGNFTEIEAQELLQSIADFMNPNDRFLIGLDTTKPREILEAAYNDSKGVTCEFNKNVLHVINRKFNANFDMEAFDHLAFYNPEKEQVEMHLVAKEKMKVEVADLDLSVNFEKGETIHTEICRKFSRESAMKMFSEANLSVQRWFSDPREWFSLVELVV
jgi:L-histidine N-alpha-methyltransferase